MYIQIKYYKTYFLKIPVIFYGFSTLHTRYTKIHKSYKKRNFSYYFDLCLLWACRRRSGVKQGVGREGGAVDWRTATQFAGAS